MKNRYTQKIRAFVFFCILSLFSFNGFAQVGIGTTDPKTMLDVNGALSLREGPEIKPLNITNGIITLPGATPYSLYRIVGPSADFSIDGVVKVADADGQLLTLINTTDYIMTIKSNDTPAAINRIVCPSNADLFLTGANSSVTLQYNKQLSKWIIIGYSDVGGYGKNIYKKIGANDASRNANSFDDMANMSITFTPRHSVVYVNFSASGTMDKGPNFDSNAYANFQLVKDNTPVVGTTTLATAGTSNSNFIYISNFPFVETFEDDSPTRSSWYLKEYVSPFQTTPWEYRTGSYSGLNYAHSGIRNLYFDGDFFLGSGAVTKVLSPVMDISSLTNPTLTFWYAQPAKGTWFPRNNELKVYYRRSYADDWVELWRDNTAVRPWAEKILALPNPSSTYQIAFEGIGKDGQPSVVDDVTINGTGGGGGSPASLDTAWNAGFTMYPVNVEAGVETTIKVQWLRDGKLPRTLRNDVVTDASRSHRNITIID